MDLSTLLKEETIILNLEAQSKEEAITKMSANMKNAGFISNIDAYREAVFARESKGSTGIGFGVAIPHGKSTGVNSPGLAFARLSQPIDWQALDDQPVSMFFLIAVPNEKADQEHLQILAAISRKIIHEAYRKQLMSADTSQDILQLLSLAEQEDQ